MVPYCLLPQGDMFAFPLRVLTSWVSRDQSKESLLILPTRTPLTHNNKILLPGSWKR